MGSRDRGVWLRALLPPYWAKGLRLGVDLPLTHAATGLPWTQRCLRVGVGRQEGKCEVEDLSEDLQGRLEAPLEEEEERDSDGGGP